MADRWAVATGNWSNTATWDGGTLPTAADDVYADGKTVTIDQDVTVLSIRNTQRSGGTSGGSFVVSTTRSITASIITGLTTASCLTCSGVAGTTVTIIGNVNAGNGHGINVTGGNTVNVTGTLTGAPNGQGGAVAAINNNASGQVNVTGTVNGGGGTGGAQNHGIINASTGAVNVTGNVNAGFGGCHGIRNASSGAVTVTGNVLAGNPGGATSNNNGISNDGTGTVIVNGSITSTTYLAVTNNSSGTVTINGTCYCSSRPPFSCSSTGRFIVNGDIIASSSGVFLGEGITLISPSATLTHTYRSNNAGAVGVARSLYTGGQNLGQPTAANVRQGTTFGVSNEFTGTCAVPPAGSVALGVPVDNTTGTGLINQTVLQAALEAALAPNAASIVERSTNDNKAITFSWPVSGATITGQKSIDNGAYANVLGAISFLRTESNRHYYTLAYNAADRNTVESSIRYKMTDGTYTKYFNLHVVPSGDVDVVVTPLQAVVDQMIRGTRIEVPLGYTGTVGPVVVTDTSNNPIDISAPSELIISKKWRGDILVIPDGSITRSGAGNNQFTISASGATLIPGEHAWALRRLSDKFVFAKGDWVVKQTATKD